MAQKRACRDTSARVRANIRGRASDTSARVRTVRMAQNPHPHKAMAQNQHPHKALRAREAPQRHNKGACARVRGRGRRRATRPDYGLIMADYGLTRLWLWLDSLSLSLSPDVGSPDPRWGGDCRLRTLGRGPRRRGGGCARPAADTHRSAKQRRVQQRRTNPAQTGPCARTPTAGWMARDCSMHGPG
jgi:hypothetical protein